MQTAYHVIVASSAANAESGRGDLWDSGKVASNDSIDIQYRGRELHSAARYYWSVKVWDNKGRVSRWAPADWWEMGLLNAEDWSGAQWISGEPGPAAPLLRTEFNLEKPVKRARLYIAAGGYYAASINGSRTGDAVLDPGFTAYQKRILYATYDVRKQLRQGANAIGVTLGRGFYSIDVSRKILWWDHAPWLAKAPVVLAVLDVTYTDNTHKTVVTGPDWTTHAGPSTADSLYRGESYDARLEIPGWDKPGLDTFGWTPVRTDAAPGGSLCAQMAEPMRVVNTVAASTITQPRPGVYVLRFPVMMAGWARLAVSGAAGAAVTLRLGERLRADGTVDNDGDPGLTPGEIQRYDYILSGRDNEEWEPQFSYAGFQYVQVEGFPGTPSTQSIVAREVHSDVAGTGSFESSNPLLNRIHALCKRAILNNLHSIPTDTPTYEKRGWSGDAMLDSAQAVDNFSMQRFYTKWVNDLADTQDRHGQIADIAPGIPESLDPTWSSVFIVLPWRVYQEYGDREIISAHYDAMKRYVDYLSAKSTTHLVKGFYGDWVSPGLVWPPEGPDLLANANYYRDALLFSKMAGVLGLAGDEAEYATLASTIRKAFNAQYLDASAVVYRTERQAGYRQASNAVPLDMHIAPAQETAALLAKLSQDVRAHGNHLGTGAFGTAALLPVLTVNGEVDLAYAIASQTTFPGWGSWVGLDRTAACEEWDCAKARSRDHAFLGSVDDWFFKYLAGIRPAAPGYTQIDIRPYVPRDLESVSASIETPMGKVVSSWTQKGGIVTMQVTVPPNATANVWVPGHATPTHTGSGSYTYAGSIR